MQTQVYRTKSALEALDYEVEFYCRHTDYHAGLYLCAHVFFAGLQTYFETVSLASRGIPVVLSTIHLRGSTRKLSRLLYKYANDLLERIPVGVLNDTVCARRQVNLARAVLPNTRFESEYCQQALRVGSDKIRIIPNAVDTKWLDQSMPSVLPTIIPSQPFVFAAGRVNDPRKNFDLVARACLDLGVPLLLAGPWDDSIKGECSRNLRMALAHPSRLVTHVGALEAGSILLAMLYQRCRVFALPSDFETPGLAALEAGYCGANVVITSVGGTSEYFQDQAIYVRPRNLAELRSAIAAALVGIPQSSLRERIARDFTWTRAAELTARAYEELV